MGILPGAMRLDRDAMIEPKRHECYKKQVHAASKTTDPQLIWKIAEPFEKK
jgi:hypothetical protein